MPLNPAKSCHLLGSGSLKIRVGGSIPPCHQRTPRWRFALGSTDGVTVLEEILSRPSTRSTTVSSCATCLLVAVRAPPDAVQREGHDRLPPNGKVVGLSKLLERCA
jgi:hypothetical protein